MSGRRWTDEELEGLLRKAFQALPEEGEASPAVVTAVLRRIQAEGGLRPAPGMAAADGGKAASPLNALAFALASGLALGWAGTGLWPALGPGFVSLMEGALAGLVDASLRWVFRSLTETAKTLLLFGFGDFFPLLLLGSLFLALVAVDRRGRAER
ncbi:MAG TPA: hypothetical protein GXX28_04435 [Firmicutes bacterium]|nr:hypothetical protein [Bacillota bacterium]